MPGAALRVARSGVWHSDARAGERSTLDDLPGYAIGELLHNSSSSAVYRGRRLDDGAHVVVKRPQANTISARQLTRYRNEYEILRSIDFEGVIKVHDLLRHQQQLALILEEFDGVALKEWLKVSKPSLLDRLHVAVDVARSLGEVHDAGIIHKDINSQNVMIDPATGRTKLIDFGIATRLRSQKNSFQFPTALEGTLAYIAPEQTGRMNHSIDHRADWYSFGITLYELFSGTLPHESDDPLESVHFHIAGKPPSLHERDERIPQALANVVTKLIQKAPEDRYQSAEGVAADLERCVSAMESGEALEPFDLGSMDRIDQFDLPQRLYGREGEIAELLGAFERVAAGSVEALLVAGNAGIGKSSLVREMYEPITRRRGYFVSGKYDQLREDVPFSALVDALQDLVGQLLTENEESVKDWRKAIQSAVGVNGQVIVDVIPSLELIIGPQAGVPPLPGVEAENRFKMVFKSFVQVFAKSAHPLVLFLDDMQWADSASLNLVTILLTAMETEALLVVQAYRDGDVSVTHPLSMAVKEQKEHGVHVGRLELAELGSSDVARLLADTMHEDASSVGQLAETVHKKTGGNPFFVRQFLQSLCDDGLIAFEAEGQRFRYDVDAINASAITDNVAELLTAKLERWPQPVRNVLRLAAAIGRRFDIGTLSILDDCDEGAVSALLAPALAEEFIVPISELESLGSGELDAPLGYRRLKFMHDRVQQAAYDLIAVEDRPAIHLAIGRVRLGESSEERQLDRRLFDIVNHMNQGAALIEEDRERKRLAELNLRAGAKARNSTAYPLAIRCYRHALELLGGEKAWKDHGALAAEAHSGLAEALALTTRCEEALSVLEAAITYCNSPARLAALYALKVNTYLMLGQMPEALSCGSDAARALGVDLPQDEADVQAALQNEIESILERTGDVGVENLPDLPVMTKPEEVALMTLLTNCLPAAYQTDQQLFALMCCKMVILSLDSGNCPLSARAYGSFGALLSGAFGRHDEAFRFTKVAVELAHKLDDPSVFSGVYFLLAMFASHWNEPVDESIALFKMSADYGLQTGDHVHLGYSVTRRISHQQFRGMQLDELCEEAFSVRRLLESIGDSTLVSYLVPRVQLAEWLRGNRRFGDSLGNDDETEEEFTAAVKARGNLSFESDWFMQLMKHRYMCGKLGEALEYAREAERLLPFSTGFVTQVEQNFFYSLILTGLHGTMTEEQAELDELLRENQRQLEQWAAGAPANYHHMYLLVEAERARIAGRKLDALALYDEAIAEATNQGFVNIEALGAELAARFWYGQDKPDFGGVYLNRALDAYSIWGANGKIEDLRAEFGMRSRHDKGLSITAGSTTMGGSADSNALDLGTALKASQAIASEIRLEKLVEKMVDIVLENVGGEHAVLVIETDGEFLVQGVKNNVTGESRILTGEPLTHSVALSRGIVNYVIRTADHAVLTDPALRGRFSNDAYVRNRRPKSVLCAPILYKGKLTGVIYLENNQVAGAFTPNRLEALNVLMSQIAASIENAMLYTRQEQQARSIELANAALEKEVRERKAAEEELSTYKDHLEEIVAQRTQELERAQGRLVELSRRAGMSEVASGVLHNVGNVMNSVNVGAHVARDAVKALRVEQLGRVCEQLDRNAGRLAEFLGSDPAGSRIPEYLDKLSRTLVTDKQRIADELERLLEHLDHMKRVIAAQQSYAKSSGLTEVCTIKDIVETALAISEVALRNAGIQVAVRCEESEPALLDRHQILQILINLISNAKHALQDNEMGSRQLTIAAARDGPEFSVEVSDNGMGIPEENLSKVFNHGFTTKKTGHGFGLHNCANAAQEMGGTLQAFSDGHGGGARFMLRLPVNLPDDISLETGAA